MNYVEVNPLQGTNIVDQVEVPEHLTVLKDKERPLPHQCLYRILTAKDGDTRIVWDNRDITQINEAKKMFDELIAKGMVPHRVGKDGKPAKEMTRFDPDAQEVIFLPIGSVKASGKPLGLVAGG